MVPRPTFLLFVSVLILQLAACRRPEPPPAPAVGVLADSAMVVTGHFRAAEIARDVLRRGGNAFDAAFAAHFALAVLHPRAGNLGGGGFAVFRLAGGQTGSLDFREKAPAAATRDMFLDSAGEAVDSLSRYGALAVGVPGSVRGLFRLHERYGRLPYRPLLDPAIRLAMAGYPLTASEAERLNRYRSLFETVNPGKALPMLRAGEWQAGDTIRYAELGETLKRIRAVGAEDFYGGRTAELLVAEMQRSGGLISPADLSGYEAEWREPVSCSYKNYRLIAMGLPSSGGILLCQLLHGLAMESLPPYGSTAMIHRLVELEKRAYADRAAYLGDPGQVEVPVEQLLDSAYLQRKFASIRPDSATPYQQFLDVEAVFKETYETTHISVVDAGGNALALTSTLNGNYGSGLYVQGAGFVLNNQMDDFSAKPGVPNQYGLVGAEANAVAPGKRMLSSMSPTILEKDGRLWMVLGGPGGSTIITSVFQSIVRVAEYGWPMQEAVDRPRFHHQWIPDAIQYREGAIGQAQQDSLRAMGHKLKKVNYLGKIEAILRRPDGRLEGAADFRRGEDDRAAGY